MASTQKAKRNTQTDVFCGGIYIERDYIFALIGKFIFDSIEDPKDPNLFYSMPDTLDYIEERIFERDGTAESARKRLNEATKWLATYKINENIIDLKNLSVGCYGPFSSLNKRKKQADSRYGYIVLSSSKKTGYNEGYIKPGVKKSPLAAVRKFENNPDYELTDFPLYEEIIKGFRYKKQKPEIFIETDASMGALGEFHFRRLIKKYSNSDRYDNNSIVFIILREGIGAGIYFSEETTSDNNETFIRNRGLYKGCLHSEIGHITVQRVAGDNFEGVKCPNHQHYCLASFASSLALLKRANVSSIEEIDPSGRDVLFHAEYIAQLCATVTVMLAPSMIVLEGPVMEIEGFLTKVRRAFRGYIGEPAVPKYPELDRTDGGFIQTPRAFVPGAYGAFYHAVLAARAEKWNYLHDSKNER